jgi:hypothetical protein
MLNKNNLVYFNLVGGIGNQLFIYFAGQYFEKISGKRVFYRFTRLSRNDSNHNSSILDLSLKADLKSTSKLWEKLNVFLLRLEMFFLRHKFEVLKNTFKRFSNLHVSQGLGFDAELAKFNNKKNFFGYFQTAIYFESINTEKEVIVNVKNPSQALIEEIEVASLIQPVMLHIRRGDYLNNPEIGVLSSSYYENAINELNELIGVKDIWVFCDDIDSAAEILSFVSTNRLKFIDRQRFRNDTESLILMSMGRALIMANSSFSYWAGLLNSRDKIVLTPDKWFFALEDPPQLYPDNWRKIKSTWGIS